MSKIRLESTLLKVLRLRVILDVGGLVLVVSAFCLIVSLFVVFLLDLLAVVLGLNKTSESDIMLRLDLLAGKLANILWIVSAENRPVTYKQTFDRYITITRPLPWPFHRFLVDDLLFGSLSFTFGLDFCFKTCEQTQRVS